MAKPTCAWDECAEEAHARGLCGTHYQVARKTGILDRFPAVISARTHFLSDIDLTSKTATCAKCGPSTPIWVRPSGKSSCATPRPRTAEQNAKLSAGQRARYRKDIDRSREAAREKNGRRRQARIAAISALKLESGCVDCGYKEHPAALHFDHVDPSTKSFGIARNLTCSWDRLLEEIAKCVVRCANCHAIRSVNEGHIGRPRMTKGAPMSRHAVDYDGGKRALPAQQREADPTTPVP